MALPWEEYGGTPASTAPTSVTTESAVGPWTEYSDAAANAYVPGSTATHLIRTPGQELLHQLGLLTRTGLTGATGTAAMAADLPATLTNIYRAGKQALGGEATTPMAYPSHSFQEGLTKLGLPVAETPGERLQNAVGILLSGAKFDPLAKLAQEAAAAKFPAPNIPPQPSVRAQTLKNSIEAGLTIPPRQAEAGVGSLAMEGLGGSPRVNAAAEVKNAAAVDDMARKAIGFPKGAPLTPETLDSASKAAWQAGYEPIEQIGTITTGRIYRQDLQKIVDKFQTQSFPDASKPAVLDLVRRYAVKQYDSADAVKTISILRADGNAAFRAGGVENNALAFANKAIAKAIEDNIELNLASKGAGAAEMLNNFRGARTQLAKLHTVEDALQIGTGSVNALKLASRLQSGKILTDELKTIAEAASAFPKAMHPPTGGSPSPFTGFEGSMMAGGAIGGRFIPGFDALAAIPAARYGLRGLVNSSPYQRAFIQNAGMPSASLFGNPNVQRAIPSIYQLFNQSPTPEGQ